MNNQRYCCPNKEVDEQPGHGKLEAGIDRRQVWPGGMRYRPLNDWERKAHEVLPAQKVHIQDESYRERGHCDGNKDGEKSTHFSSQANLGKNPSIHVTAESCVQRHSVVIRQGPALARERL